MRRGIEIIAAATRAGGASLLLAVVALATQLAPASVAASLQCERQALLAGEWWRIVSCHFTHWGGNHLAWDLATFALLGVACERRGRARMLIALLVAAVVIPLAVVALCPQLGSYRGLSGLDTALFALLAVDLYWASAAGGKIVVALFAAAFACKTIIEAGGGAVFVDASGFSSVPLAHLIGAAVGALIGVYFRPACGGAIRRNNPFAVIAAPGKAKRAANAISP